jgi:type VI protein secretion system component VasA
MSPRRYLPSAQFATIALSLVLSAGLVYGADLITQPPKPTTAVSTAAPAQPDDSANWEAALYAIQAANASTSLSAPNPQTVQQMLAAVQSPNLTDTIGKTILINLSSAESQGMGNDVPTQDQITAAAAAQIKSQQASPSSYTAADLTVVPVSDASLRAYGNGVMQALSAHPDASEQATLLSIDYAVEGGDKTQGAKLASIGAAYQAAATDLLAVPVPQTLVPLHLEVVNNLLSISATYADMQTVYSDPIRAMVGLKTYESLMDAGARVFTNIAQELSKDGILFNKDEPGSAWSIFLSSQ